MEGRVVGDAHGGGGDRPGGSADRDVELQVAAVFVADEHRVEVGAGTHLKNRRVCDGGRAAPIPELDGPVAGAELETGGDWGQDLLRHETRKGRRSAVELLDAGLPGSRAAIGHSQSERGVVGHVERATAAVSERQQEAGVREVGVWVEHEPATSG